MDIAVLQQRFGDRLTSAARSACRPRWPGARRRTSSARSAAGSNCFPTGGLFLGPTHAIQVGSPLENILAMYRTAGSLAEQVDDAILSIGDEETSGKINLAKLF